MNNKRKNNPLSRKKGHRIALLSNMASSLIKEKRIFTTLAKAKRLRKYIEPIITKSKIDSSHSRRKIFSYLRDKFATNELFKKSFEIVRKRPGGYVRIIKVTNRFGDNSKISFVELVDFNNSNFLPKKSSITSTRKKIRRSGKKIKKRKKYN